MIQSRMGDEPVTACKLPSCADAGRGEGPLTAGATALPAALHPLTARTGLPGTSYRGCSALAFAAALAAAVLLSLDDGRR